MFQWRVAKSGYRWEDGAGTALTLPDGIIERQGEDLPECHTAPIEGWDYRLYEPLEESGLFRTFANTPTTPEAILGFADRYGSLGDEPCEWEDEPPQAPEEETRLGEREDHRRAVDQDTRQHT